MSRTCLLDADRSAVVVIDLQGRLMEMAWRSDLVLAATRRLMKLAAIFARPVVLTEQYPEGLGTTHPDVRSVYDEIETEKRCVEKVSFGCCGDDGFNRTLDEVLPGGLRSVVLVDTTPPPTSQRAPRPAPAPSEPVAP